ncbi:MAG: methyl-accepting chemotaxis protein [Pseudomonadales bacterium]|nr:methyl-accepting chemotaxis protein [Pseudomonadales bacterium]
MSLRNISVSTRASLSFAVMALIVLLVGGLSLLQMQRMNQDSTEVGENWMPSILALNDMSREFLRVRALTLRLFVNRDEQAMRTTEQGLEQIKTQLLEAQERYRKLISSQAEQAVFDRYLLEQNAYLREQSKFVELSRLGKLEEGRAVVNGELNGHASNAAQALVDLTELNKKGAAASIAEGQAAFATAINWVVIFIVLAVVLTIVLALVLTRSIVKPLSEAVAVARTVASGDLSTNIHVEGSDEPAQLLEALKSMQQSLRSTIQHIADSSNQLASASEELHAVTEDTNRGLHQQNNEIEQAATAVNEMTSAVDEVARNAVSTSEASRESERTAQRGRDQVLRTVNSISSLAENVTATASEVGDLADKIRDISKVLDVIRAIAEQTNLLALNAAIEAARAGEQGRGFAVVADEVRLLAQRTQQSTQEIEQMIGGIRQGTDHAVNAMQGSNSLAHATLELAQSAGQALDEITRSITQINERNLLIASASEEQASVTREVDRNLVNIRDLSLQSSAGANQTSASSQELSRLAIDLNSLVSKFRL